MEMQKISVIMPSYNVELYIAESIESVLNQTYKNIELVVVNDGSTDKTRDIVLSYMEKDHRVKLCEQENGGLPVARNTGLENSTGKYVSFLDADDIWKPEFLEKTYRKICEAEEANDEDVFVYARTKETFLDGRESIVGPVDCVSGKLDRFIHYTNELRLRFHVSAVLISYELIKKYDLRFLPGIKMSEDTAFFIELLCVARAYYVDEALTVYKRRENSMTTEKWIPEKWADAIVVYEKIKPFVEQHYVEAMPSFYRLRNYHAYRFILKCIRHGFIEESILYMRRWESWLREFSVGDGKINDRLKCRFLLSSGPKMLKLIAMLHI